MSVTRELPSLADAAWLRAAPTQAVFDVIATGGYQARAVGGVVRNALLGLPVTDIDIATTALPEEVMRLAEAAGLGVAATGLKHGTVTVIAEHHPFEVTTLRKDVETHGRHATVAFTADWAADAGRRDFTMNALYCDRNGSVFDPLDGYRDLAARRVRFIGDPHARIREDYLRILRFFRFTAEYSTSEPDPDGLHAAIVERDGLNRLSAERLRQELLRLLVAPGVNAAVAAMQGYGILAQVMPAAPRPRSLARIVEIEAGHGTARNAALRLAALAVETMEDAGRLDRRFRLSRAEHDVLQLAAAVRALDQHAPDQRRQRLLLYRRGPTEYRCLIALAWARALGAPTDDRQWSQALTLPDRWTAPILPVSGADIVARGVSAGPAVGRVLRRLEAEWIADDFAADREALLGRI